LKFQKIRALGHRTIKNLWKGNIEVTEKVDGSQYRFWTDEFGGHHHGSKNMELNPKDPDKLFSKTVQHMEGVRHLVAESMCLFGETLRAPQHNKLKYDRVPDGNLALWGAYDQQADEWMRHDVLVKLANQLGVEVAPLICTLPDNTDPLTLDALDKLLDRESFLGGAKIEGLVFKNYDQQYLVGDVDLPFLAGKFVSEAFKEKMGVKKQKGGTFDAYKESFRTEARWLKMIGAMRELGKLEYNPKDIGSLLKYGHADLEQEHDEEISAWLYKNFIKQIKSEAMRGFPEFYKRWLVENSDESS
jgi:hypothetical protein